MKKIERPMSTTIVLDALFHECKTVEEWKNVLMGVDENDIFEYARWVDKDTFQPWMAVVIKKENKPVSEWQKYAFPLVLKAAE